MYIYACTFKKKLYAFISFLLIKLQREKTVKCSFYNNTSLQAEIWCFLMIPKNCKTLIRIIEYGRTDLFAKSWTGFITFAFEKGFYLKKKLFFELVPTPTCIWNWKIISVEKSDTSRPMYQIMFIAFFSLQM